MTVQLQNAGSKQRCHLWPIGATTRVVTAQSRIELFLLAFLQIGKGHVFIALSTFHPNDAWVTKTRYATTGDDNCVWNRKEVWAA